MRSGRLLLVDVSRYGAAECISRSHHYQRSKHAIAQRHRFVPAGCLSLSWSLETRRLRHRAVDLPRRADPRFRYVRSNAVLFPGGSCCLHVGVGGLHRALRTSASAPWQRPVCFDDSRTFLGLVSSILELPGVSSAAACGSPCRTIQVSLGVAATKRGLRGSLRDIP